jgi:hypothetical protein
VRVGGFIPVGELIREAVVAAGGEHVEFFRGVGIGAVFDAEQAAGAVPHEVERVTQSTSGDFDLWRSGFRVETPERRRRRHFAALVVEVGLACFIAVGPRAVADVKETIRSFRDVGGAMIVRADPERIGRAEPWRGLGPSAMSVGLASEDSDLVGDGRGQLVALVGHHVEPALAV